MFDILLNFLKITHHLSPITYISPLSILRFFKGITNFEQGILNVEVFKQLIKLNEENNFIFEVKSILVHARQKAYTAVNTAMVEAYWLVGKRIVEEEQNGNERAEYGKKSA